MAVFCVTQYKLKSNTFAFLGICGFPRWHLWKEWNEEVTLNLFLLLSSLFNIKQQQKKSSKTDFGRSTIYSFLHFFCQFFSLQSATELWKTLSTHAEGIRNTLLISRNTAVRKIRSYSTTRRNENIEGNWKKVHKKSSKIDFGRSISDFSSIFADFSLQSSP